MDHQVKCHFLCVISICNKDGVEALLFRPYPHQSENSYIPEVEDVWTKGEKNE